MKYKINFYTFFFIAIFVVAFLIRLPAIAYGLPYGLFGDEIVQIAAGFRMLEGHTLRANFPFYYLPPMMAYLLAPLFALYGVFGLVTGKFHALGEFRHFVLLYREYFLIILRLWGVFFGMASLLIFFAVARKFFDKYFSLLAMSLWAFDFLHLQESMTGRFWVPVTFFILAGGYAMIRIYESREAHWYGLAALAIGLGFGMGYVAVLLFPWFWLAHFLKKDGFSFFEKIKQKWFWFGNALSIFLIGIFSYANVYAFVRQFGYSGAILLNFFGVSVSTQFKPGLSQGSHVADNFFAIVANFRDLNPMLFVLGITGFFLFAFSREPIFKKLFLVGMPLVYFAGASFVFPWIDHRYMMPAYPFFIMAAVYGLRALWFGGRMFRKISMWILCVGLFAFPLGLDFFYVRGMLAADTTVQAKKWAESVMPEGSRVITNIYFTNNKTGLEFLRKHNSYNWIDSKNGYLLTLPDNQYPHPNYFVYDLNYLRDAGIFRKDVPADFIVYAYYFKQVKTETIDSLPYRKELIKTFYPKKEVSDTPNLYGNLSYPYLYLPFVDNLGPYVEVYKVIK